MDYTTGKSSLLAAVTLVAATVGMAGAQGAGVAGASDQQKCTNESIYIKMGGSDAKQIKGDCQQVKQGATQIKLDSTHIKMQSQQLKNTTTGQDKVTAPRDAASGMATGR
jgi:hypothetical protein